MFEELLTQIGSYLDRHKFLYMIVDGQAVLLYGEPCVTRDIDVALGVNTGCFSELLSFFNELNLKPIPDGVESFVKKTMVLPATDESTGI